MSNEKEKSETIQPLKQKKPEQPLSTQYKPLQATQPTQATKASSEGTKPLKTQRKSREGALNPFSGHKHTDASREKMSQTQKARYQNIRDQISEERITRIVEDVVYKYLKGNL